MDKLSKGFSVAILGAYAVIGVTLAYDIYDRSELKDKIDDFIKKHKKAE